MLYHRVPKGLVGEELYPLNELKTVYPEVAEFQLRKYNNRLALTKQRIPSKNWLWNDVIHFSPVHPEKVVNQLVKLGFSKFIKSTWFEIDPSVFNFNKSNSLVFLHNREKSGFNFNESEFEEYDQSRISLYTEVPENTIRYFEQSIRQGINPLMFGGIPHILHYGSINVGNVKLIEVSR
jgi:hypothetical protein